MAERISGEKVHKSLVMDKALAGTIGTWAAGAGVGFSEAVRLLRSRGLATWPGSSRMAPAGSTGEVLDAIARLESSLQRSASAVLAAVGELERAAVEHGEAPECDEAVDDADEGEYGDEDSDEFWSQQEFDEWFESKRQE